MCDLITDYLKYDNFRYGGKTGHNIPVFDVSIDEVDENPYYVNVPKHQMRRRHWCLTIKSMVVPTDDPDDPKPKPAEIGRTKFMMSTVNTKKPTLRRFSDHIRKECIATLNVFDKRDIFVWDIPVPDRGDIRPDKVHQFMKAVGIDVTTVDEFVKVYDDVEHRIYNNVKWIYYTVKGYDGLMCGTVHPIGEHLLAFLDIGKYFDHYEST